MQRKVKTTTLQCEILWTLAETNEYPLSGLLNNLRTKFPERSSTELRGEVERSIGILYRSGCLFLARLEDNERKWIRSEEMIRLDLAEMIRFDASADSWIVCEVGVSDLIILLTQGGLRWLELIGPREDI
jgi:hypothetical protein